MYKLIKEVLNNGNFELSSILNKIETVWLENKITDEERAELVNVAQGKADYKHSIDLYAKVLEIDKRVKVVEEKLANIDVAEDTEDTEEVTYPEYEVGKYYYNGDKVTFEGIIYNCIAPDGVVCVWSPSEYPTYWEITTE